VHANIPKIIQPNRLILLFRPRKPGAKSFRFQPFLKQFNARVHLASMRPLPDAQKIMENVVQHLAGTQGAEVELSLSISANHKDGFNDSVKRTVLEHCRTLRFDHSEFHNG